MRPRSARSPCAYRPAIAPNNSSRATMLIRLILNPADENRSGANQMRQHISFREHFRRGNARLVVKPDQPEMIGYPFHGPAEFDHGHSLSWSIPERQTKM